MLLCSCIVSSPVSLIYSFSSLICALGGCLCEDLVKPVLVNDRKLKKKNPISSGLNVSFLRHQFGAPGCAGEPGSPSSPGICMQTATQCKVDLFSVNRVINLRRFSICEERGAIKVLRIQISSDNAAAPFWGFFRLTSISSAYKPGNEIYRIYCKANKHLHL